MRTIELSTTLIGLDTKEKSSTRARTCENAVWTRKIELIPSTRLSHVPGVVCTQDK